MQTMKIETTKKLKMIDLQTDVLKTSKKKYEITDNIVVSLTPESRCVCRSFNKMSVTFQYKTPVRFLIRQSLLIGRTNVCHINGAGNPRWTQEQWNKMWKHSQPIGRTKSVSHQMPKGTRGQFTGSRSTAKRSRFQVNLQPCNENNHCVTSFYS